MSEAFIGDIHGVEPGLVVGFVACGEAGGFFGAGGRLWSEAEPACPGGAATHLNGLRIFERRGWILSRARARVFQMKWPGPDWRKVGWIVGGLAFLFLLGRVTMWWRGVD